MNEQVLGHTKIADRSETGFNKQVVALSSFQSGVPNSISKRSHLNGKQGNINLTPKLYAPYEATEISPFEGSWNSPLPRKPYFGLIDEASVHILATNVFRNDSPGSIWQCGIQGY